jgi:hypothetical protein
MYTFRLTQFATFGTLRNWPSLLLHLKQWALGVMTRRRSMPFDACFAGDRSGQSWDLATQQQVAYHANFFSFTNTCDYGNMTMRLAGQRWVTDHGRERFIPFSSLGV